VVRGIEKLWSVPDVGKMLSLCSGDVRVLIHSGRLAAIRQPVRSKAGGRPRLRVRESDLRQYLASLEQVAPVEPRQRPCVGQSVRPRRRPMADGVIRLV
jgi:hypothetical protein